MTTARLCYAGPGASPVRISALTALTKCPASMILQRAFDRGSGAAADTGSAVGRLVQLYHEGWLVDDAIERARRECPTEFPLADLPRAETLLGHYVRDPRNPREVVAKGSCELEVRLVLPPDASDPTGAPIHLVGHVDQIRHHPDGVLRVWDTKAGKLDDGLAMTRVYAWQLAAYALAATATLGREVRPGGIIRLAGYETRDGGEQARAGTASTHYETPWTLDECATMLASVSGLIAMIRRGDVLMLPGAHCRWCPGEAPNLCADKILPEHVAL